jgi:hypothetical protein
MPITKALKINAVITRVILHTLDKWRTLGRTDWNQELTPTTDEVPFEVRLFRQAERYSAGKSGSR